MLSSFPPGSISSGVKTKKRLKANLEWLEVRIVVLSEWLVERWIVTVSRWKMNDLLGCHQTLHLSCGQGLRRNGMQNRSLSPISPWRFEGKCKLCWRDVGVFLAFPGSSEFGHLSTSTGCRSDIRVCQGAHNCDVPYKQLPWAPWNLCRPWSHPCVYHLDWFFRCRHARPHQGSSHPVSQIRYTGAIPSSVVTVGHLGLLKNQLAKIIIFIYIIGCKNPQGLKQSYK